MDNSFHPANKSGLMLLVGVWTYTGAVIGYFVGCVLNYYRIRGERFPSWLTQLLSDDDWRIVVVLLAVGEGIMLIIAIVCLIWRRVRRRDWWG